MKAKVGPKIMTLMCDAEVFPLIPVKKEVKATVSGIYITAVKGIRGPLDTPQKKKAFSPDCAEDNTYKTQTFRERTLLFLSLLFSDRKISSLPTLP